MKNKKIFGVLSILDIIIIVFILAIVLPMLHYYMKFNEKGFSEQKKLERFVGQKVRNEIAGHLEWRTKALDVDVSFKNLTAEDLKKIRVGDRELQPNGDISGEIMWLGEPKSDYFIVNVGTLNNDIFVKTLPQNNLHALPAKLRLTGMVGDNGILSFKDKTVKELAEFKFETKGYDAYYVIEMPPLVKEE